VTFHNKKINSPHKFMGALKPPLEPI